MIYCLLYHRTLGNFRSTTPLELFKRHLVQLKETCHFTYPGCDLSSSKVKVCLFFDDAYADFYYCVFPLLKQLNIPCTLAVPTSFISKNVKEDKNKRLSALQSEQNKLSSYAYCSWEELGEMSSSKLVHIASHTHCHVNLSKLCKQEIQQELISSKHLIKDFIGISPTTFVYPFGGFSKTANKLVKQHFTYSFRIGSCINKHWNQNVLYRICCDGKADISSIFHWKNALLYKAKYFSNQLQNR